MNSSSSSPGNYPGNQPVQSFTVNITVEKALGEHFVNISATTNETNVFILVRNLIKMSHRDHFGLRASQSQQAL